MNLRHIVYASLISGALAMGAAAPSPIDATPIARSQVPEDAQLHESATLIARVRADGEKRSISLPGQDYTIQMLAWFDKTAQRPYLLILSDDYFAVVPRHAGLKTYLDIGADGSVDALYTNPQFIGEELMMDLVEKCARASKDSTTKMTGLVRLKGDVKVQREYDELTARINAGSFEK